MTLKKCSRIGSLSLKNIFLSFSVGAFGNGRVMPSDYKVRQLTPLPSGGIGAASSSGIKSVKVTKVEIDTLTHATTCAKRNNHLHNSCIEMLK